MTESSIGESAGEESYALLLPNSYDGLFRNGLHQLRMVTTLMVYDEIERSGEGEVAIPRVIASIERLAAEWDQYVRELTRRAERVKP